MNHPAEVDAALKSVLPALVLPQDDWLEKRRILSSPTKIPRPLLSRHQHSFQSN
jgi:hypothetical protein